MRETMSFVTSFGAFAPGISTEPMTRSESTTARSRSSGLDAAVLTRPWKWSSRYRRRWTFVSKTVTSAPRPTAMTAAFAPATPPPMTVTRADRVPGTPDISRPRPPAERIRVAAPTVGARRPATSLIGASSGRPPPGELHRLVGDRGDAVGDEAVGERAVGGEVQVGEQHEVVAEVAVLARDRLLDLQQQLGARPHLGRRRRAGSLRRPRTRHPAWTSRSPAPRCTNTSWPAATRSCTPAGVSATRYSLFLTSVGTLILIV